MVCNQYNKVLFKHFNGQIVALHCNKKRFKFYKEQLTVIQKNIHGGRVQMTRLILKTFVNR